MAIRILFSKLDTSKVAELVDIVEALVEEYGGAEVEATILPSPPTAG